MVSEGRPLRRRPSPEVLQVCIFCSTCNGNRPPRASSVAGQPFFADLQRKPRQICAKTPAGLRQNPSRPAPKPRQTCAKIPMLSEGRSLRLRSSPEVLQVSIFCSTCNANRSPRASSVTGQPFFADLQRKPRQTCAKTPAGLRHNAFLSLYLQG